ncbi:MAG: hypothetical protein Q9224_005283, partial [Gallowayella concinna]
YVSPRKRAQRTLELLNLGCTDSFPWQEEQQDNSLNTRTNAQAQVDEDIREWDYGDYEGLTSATIREQRDKNGDGSWDIWRDGCPGGESPADVTKRLDRLIDDIRVRFHQKVFVDTKIAATPGDVLVVAHGHILRAFAMRWIGRELTEGVSLLLEGNLYTFNPKDNFTLSAFDFPLSGGLHHRGLATGDREIVWCCENTTSYITIRTPMQVWSDPGFDAVETLHLAINDVEAQVFKNGIARLPGGQWEFGLDPINSISALDTGPPQFGLPIKHLTWPALRDALKALNDFITDRKLAHHVRGLQFGINSAHLGQVGKGAFG